MTKSARTYCYRGCLRPPAYKKLCANCAGREYGNAYHESATVKARRRANARAKTRADNPRLREADQRAVATYINRSDNTAFRRAALGLPPEDSPAVTPADHLARALEIATRPRAATAPSKPDDDARLAESVARALAQKSQQTTPIDNDASSS